jgi:hypothetical protein
MAEVSLFVTCPAKVDPSFNVTVAFGPTAGGELRLQPLRAIRSAKPAILVVLKRIPAMEHAEDH